MKLVTVLMPVYNVEKWIEDSLNSILDQTHSNLQVLIIDDGSEDQTPEIIKSFRDGRIEYHRITHAGLSAALNVGLTLAKSEYVARMDGDDICRKERIKLQLKFMISNPEYGVVGSNFIVFDELTKKTIKVKMPEKNRFIKEQLPGKCCLGHPTIMFKKNLVQSVGGYNKEYQIAQDWDLYLKLLFKTKLYNIQNYLVTIRKHSSNISNSLDLHDLEDKKVAEHFYSDITSNEGSSEKIIAQADFNLGYFYYYRDELVKARPLLHKAFQKNPQKISYLRYFVMSKYFSKIITIMRKYRLNRFLDPLRYFDKNNIFFRNKF